MSREIRTDADRDRQTTIVRWSLTLHLLFWWGLFAYFAGFWFPIMATFAVDMRLNMSAFYLRLYEWGASPKLHEFGYVAGSGRMALWIMVLAGWVSISAVHIWGGSRRGLFLRVGSILFLVLTGLTLFVHWLVHYPVLKLVSDMGR